MPSINIASSYLKPEYVMGADAETGLCDSSSVLSGLNTSSLTSLKLAWSSSMSSSSEEDGEEEVERDGEELLRPSSALRTLSTETSSTAPCSTVPFVLTSSVNGFTMQEFIFVQEASGGARRSVPECPKS